MVKDEGIGFGIIWPKMMLQMYPKPCPNPNPLAEMASIVSRAPLISRLHLPTDLVSSSHERERESMGASGFCSIISSRPCIIKSMATQKPATSRVPATKKVLLTSSSSSMFDNYYLFYLNFWVLSK